MPFSNSSTAFLFYGKIHCPVFFSECRNFFENLYEDFDPKTTKLCWQLERLIMADMIAKRVSVAFVAYHLLAVADQISDRATFWNKQPAQNLTFVLFLLPKTQNK